MPMGYESDFPDEIRVDLFYDEMIAIYSLICNKWGWTEGERYANKMPVPLHAALAAITNALEVDE